VGGNGTRYPWNRLVYLLEDRPPHRDRHGWVSPEPGGRLVAAPLEAYQDLPVVALLGERGVGKTDILRTEHARLRAEGADSHFLDLDRLRSTSKLSTALGVAQEVGPLRIVVLDSLDTAVDNGHNAWEQLPELLEELGPERRNRLRLRIGCRSSRFPASLEEELEGMWPRISRLGVAALTRADVVMAAEHRGLDSSFAGLLERRRLVVPLASWPVTLEPVLAAAAEGSELPQTAVEAFTQSCERLCREINHARREAITATSPSPVDLVAAGRRVAAALQFGAQDALVELPGDGPGLQLESLARGNEPDGSGRQVPCTEHLLLKLRESALLSPLGQRRWGFCHRSFQEFLAAQYLKVHQVPEQVRQSILLIGQGRGRHVVAAQREVAAWLAAGDSGLLEEILACDPEALLLSDPAVLSGADRRRLTAALLDLAAADFTAQLDPLLLYRLDHPGLADQLGMRLDAVRPPNELYAALLIARACPHPEQDSQLIVLAENPGIDEDLRSLAVQAMTIGSEQIADRLRRLTTGPFPDLAGTALACLWPARISTRDMLGALPRPYPSKLAGAWALLHALPRLLQPEDLDDALAWASSARPAHGGYDHMTLAVEIIAWAIRTSGPPDTVTPAQGVSTAGRVADALLALTRSEYFGHPGLPLSEMDAELAARPAFRRSAARHVLEQGTAGDIAKLAGHVAPSLFPRQDAGYWAGQIPALPDEISGNLGFALQAAPDGDDERARVQELAQADQRVREATRHWFAPPPDQDLAADAQRRRDRQERDQARRAADRYDETALRTRLAALTAGEIPVRPGWQAAVLDLHRTAAGDAPSVKTSLDLSGAPSFPLPGSDLHERLITAAASVVRDAPLITADQIAPAGLSLWNVPELWALSLLAKAGRTPPGDLDAARWTGLTLALIFAYTPPDDDAQRSPLLATGLRYSGNQAGTALPALLGQLAQPHVTMIMDRLKPARTAALTVQLSSWAQQPDRDLAHREAVLDALAADQDFDVLQTLRSAIPSAGQQSSDPASASGRKWISDAVILARRDTAASLPAITAAVAVSPDLARALLERLATDTGLGEWPMDLTVLGDQDLAALYDLIAEHGPPGDVCLFDEHGNGIFGTAQQLERMRRQLAAIIADRRTQEAAAQVLALAGRHPSHGQLRVLARQLPRDIAAREWQPLRADDLLKIADDDTLRLVHDEHQLSRVVTESLRRFQRLLLRDNGWATMLWNRAQDTGSGGWWPAWEQDLSDMAATFLHYDLEARRVIINREVQVVRPALDGQRTDIHVQAWPLRPGPHPDHLTVIIECKGCWHERLTTDLATQLAGRYLARPGRHAGIYLAGYFDHKRWNNTKGNPGSRPHASHTLDSVTRTLTRIASEQARLKSVDVTAFVLDCRLPASAEDEATR
jgi:hypothetical protein